MRVTHRSALLVALCLHALACGSATRIVTQWQAPQTAPLRFHKILALAMAPETAMERQAEDALCREIEQVPCEPASLTVFKRQPDDIAALKEQVRHAGFDGALVFRVVDAREKVTYVPPTYGPTFWGYYGYARPRMPAAAGYTHTDMVVRVETSIYSLREDRLLWVGTTETMNPSSIDDLVGEIARAVRGQLQRDGLIPE